MPETRFLRTFTDLTIFAAAAGGTQVAQAFDRPITAVLIFLTGVIVIAVHSGLWAALVAAVGASLIYNFFLSEPAFTFGVVTLDQAVPLIAFNVAALLAGFLVGRLKTSASKAHSAQVETAFLLTVSDRLQSALTVGDIEQAIRGVLPRTVVQSVELFVESAGDYVRPATGQTLSGELMALVNASHPSVHDRIRLFELAGANGLVGIVRFQLADEDRGWDQLPNLKSISAILGLAIERCQLLEQVAEAQASARGEALKDAILSSISHDLRTPLTVIETAAGALRSTEMQLAHADRTKLLEAIVEQCRQLDRYTSELLDVGRIQVGLSDARMETLDLDEVVQSAVRRARKARPQPAIKRSKPDKPVLVSANAVMLEQALFNVIDNALKFGPDGPVEIEIIHGTEAASVVVRDSGPGIAERDRQKVFERFGKGGHTTKGGLGLGLFVAKGFIEAFGGTIGVEGPSTEAGGTSIVIRLPACADAQHAMTQAA